MRAAGDGVLLSLYVRPKARTNELTGWHGDALRVRVQAPPESGRANTALCKFLAGVFQLPERAVAVVAGAHSPRKWVRLESLDVDTALRRLAVWLEAEERP